MCLRIDGKVVGEKTPIGLLSKTNELDLEGLSIAPQDMEALKALTFNNLLSYYHMQICEYVK